MGVLYIVPPFGKISDAKPKTASTATVPTIRCETPYLVSCETEREVVQFAGEGRERHGQRQVTQPLEGVALHHLKRDAAVATR